MTFVLKMSTDTEMTTRLHRLWSPGNPQRRVFLSDFWMAVVEPKNVGKHRLPKNCVKFEVDPRMSKHDVREYLTKVYNLPVRDVRTEVQMGEVTYQSPQDYQYKKAIWKEEDKKFAYVFMQKSFEFPYPQLFAESEEDKEIAKAKAQQDKANLNSKFVNRDRNRLGEFYGV